MALLFSAILSLSTGPAEIPAEEVVTTILKRTVLKNPLHESIIFHIRLPRVILAIITGMALSLTGTVLQALLRNPLADPYVIGVSSGAALGATAAIALKLFNLISPAGFLGAVITIFLVHRLAQTDHKIPAETLLLTGVIVNILLSALISLIIALSHGSTHQIVLWLMGNLTETNKTLILIAGLMVMAGAGITFLFARDLNLIATGEEPAQYLGVNVETVKRQLFITVSLMTGAVVAITGLIGFVGLITPHIMRLIVGPDHRVLIPASLLAGGIFLTLADLGARMLFSPTEIPVGIVTALLGGPFFLFLLARKNHDSN